ncbi:MAG: DUF805 domain-containing protein [Treponema sp.]|jgi:TPR repeat protein/uncharacterized membrane protein YhaH (DUF805 family)|nr:DUF805 domain-containing protein [Treponema sp.]
MAFCQNCGAEMNEGVNFCPNCGKAAGEAGGNTGNQTAGKPDGGTGGIAAKLEAVSRTLAEKKKSAGKGGIEFFGIELLENFLAVLLKFKITAGRAGRKEFWMFALACFITGVVFSILRIIPVLGIIAWIASTAFGIVTFIPSITVGVRRLHDTDKSGWLMLLLLIPIVGWIIILVFYIMEGTPGRNNYDNKDYDRATTKYTIEGTSGKNNYDKIDRSTTEFTNDDMNAVNYYNMNENPTSAIEQHELGKKYGTGDGIPKDQKKAVYWFTKAADQGYVNSQYNLGLSYLNGWGVQKDLEKAIYWYTKAAEQGDADAQGFIGYCYFNGDGVPKNLKKAVHWFTKAAEQGNAKAQKDLGLCYFLVDGVPKDLEKARYWLNKSAEQGNEDAKEALGILNRQAPLSGELARLKAQYSQSKENQAKALAKLIGIKVEDAGKAIAEYTEALKRSPNDASVKGSLASAFFLRGLTFTARGEHARAITDYSDTIKYSPDHAGAIKERGQAYLDNGDFDKGIADFEELVRLDPENHDKAKIRLANAYMARGRAYDTKGDYNRAIPDYEKSLELNPDDDGARELLKMAKVDKAKR